MNEQYFGMDVGILIKPDVGNNNMQNIYEYHRERMMAHISSTLCAFFLFLMFIMIEQAQFLEFNNYDDESLDSERPSALRYHLPYEHRLYDDIYDHETSESQYATQSVAVQEINTKSGHFRWRILTDMNAMKSTIVR
ncbi:hypothetical protein HUG17_0605 [Dermatophagoides farinae]|uniref:Uncharacterized protein n=1 Tax=Dermatophagoides farinae TaxID=6954 RepID=A0A9D4SKB8_DERFA|nr:hypothetical protein HUG17_0605 [Dermatophagoides farinae]